MEEKPDVRARMLISGLVQGVGFRFSAERQGLALGLSGWVRNLPDGRVEILVEGPRDRVERLMEWCRRGPLHSRVDRVDVSWEDPRGDLKGFRIR